MIRVRKAGDRGYADHGWLKSFHTFSFAGYHDPQHMGFRALRVMNEDRVAPGKGFGTHAHDNMEIVSYVLEGELEHKDSMGNGEVLQPGEFQRISSGTGITHSEFNPSSEKPVHFYQIWLIPNERSLAPGYQQQRFHDDQLQDQVRLVASPQGEEGALRIHSDAMVYLSKLSKNQSLDLPVASTRHGWLQVLRGRVQLADIMLDTSDAAAISDESLPNLVATSDAEIMFFNLA